ncbi:FAD-dependent urate hydroxylase [Stygiomarasmius scandens]|uniref:FAD-dependent urate hydroxylase n=1 Tax=Marasmiellus scandens TaxID=2682957 RepID=A0ABR1JWF6_9AGAR
MFTSSLVLFLAISSSSISASARRTNSSWPPAQSLNTYELQSGLGMVRPEKCPPCFNCMLPAFTCGQFAECDAYNGQCRCPAGWSGIDCLTPQCDSLADGEHRRPRDDGQSCDCKDGWGGINCNVCKTDNACKGFPILGQTPDPDDADAQNMTCYKGGETVFSNHQMCDVTNRKILDTVGSERPVQVTFGCDKNASDCTFQFWVDEVESFYCALDECTSSRTVDYDFNTTSYQCNKLKCKCVPGRFICGEDGSIDISEFLTEQIKGPASFSCKTGQGAKNEGCRFEEPAMNELIDQVFGDPYITLDCFGGECLHYSQVPGYVQPVKPIDNTWVALSAAGALLVVIVASLLFWYLGRKSGSDFGSVRLPEDEAARLMTEHVPASLHFSNITYNVAGKTILSDISGCAKPGQVMAIMGASGAGKSTLLDILARKNKKGAVGGTTLVNGREVKDEEFRAVTGFVDQEDTLMSTLTVYETILYSALLRLPREMSFEAKRFRTLETMNELGILRIKDMRIGETGNRSISGGEKRRVSIACELVTSPSILFLDEPTSGLDAFNAYNVVESLVSLARDYNRTVIFTIHQPRSNIVALFDQLLVLAMGKTIYSGEFSRCQTYFTEIGKPCPPGFNIADYLIDLTVQAGMEPSSSGPGTPTLGPSSPHEDTTNIADEERALGRATHEQSVPLTVRSHSNETPPAVESTELQTRPSSLSSATGAYFKKKTSQLIEAVGSGSSQRSETPLAPKLAALVEAYAQSTIAAEIKAETEALAREGRGDAPNGNGHGGQTRDVAEETKLLRGRKRASWPTQFRILSGRAFKNLYRDPALLAAHYSSAIALALICGFFFRDVTNDIAGFQNRLGLFFFTLALFGFSCLSSLGLFANERILFMRERSNGYYSSFTYFSSKILFDILPLRLVPPLIYGGIVYGLAGLVPTVAAFWKFILILVLFNLTTASVVLLLSIAFASTSVASLVGTLIMLYNLLFTGLLINRESVYKPFQFLHTISFFHAAFEALAVNELRYLTLKEHKYGVDLEVPAATILSTFGLRAQSFWWPNTAVLGIFFAAFTIASYLTLHFFVKEKR